MSETEPNYVDVAAIRERADKATPGPWEYDGMHNEIQKYDMPGFWLIISECRSAPDQEYQQDQFKHMYDANFDFIAHARTDVPALCDEVERLQAQLAAALAILAALHETCAYACDVDGEWERYETLLEEAGGESRS